KSSHGYRSSEMTRTVACLDHVIDGAINLRDMGGYRAEDGRTVRGGHVYRSAMTHHISRAGLGALREHLGVRTVLDLRNEHELAQDGVAAFVDHGITPHHAPIGAEALVTPAERLARIQRLARGEVAWAQLYIDMSERAGQAVRMLFDLVAA